MATGSDLVDLAKQHLGEQYVFGADVPKDDSDWAGPWDCAEFISWVVYQAIEKLFGCDNNSGNPSKANAYTGYWQRDVTAGKVKRISVEEADQSPGAILLHYPSSGANGHIFFVSGPNKTIEAHSTKDGVIESVISGRRWDCGVLVPGISYDSDVPSDPADSSTPEAPTPIAQPFVYRLKTPHMKSEDVRAIQSRLEELGFDPGSEDGDFGQRTAEAVAQFQISQGVVSDGEVGRETAQLLGISLD